MNSKLIDAVLLFDLRRLLQVERLSVNRLSVNRLSVNLGNLEFAPGPLSGSVSEEADISDAGLVRSALVSAVVATRFLTEFSFLYGM